jgi:hypothetical protein
MLHMLVSLIVVKNLYSSITSGQKLDKSHILKLNSIFKNKLIIQQLHAKPDNVAW